MARAGNAGSSLFWGLTAENTFRLSDAYVGGRWEGDRRQPTLLTATHSATDARLWVNGALAGERGSPLPQRRLDTDFVVGQQGNIDGEYWNGSILALLVWDQALSEADRLRVQDQLAERFDLQLRKVRPTPETLALQSLCHVLLNSNEFLYVD